jgi:hypothetical protein
LTARLEHVVADWARRVPDIGYADLMARAHADALRHKGIPHGTVVPVTRAPSVELAVEVLGCLLADVVPVVLDPGWPPWCVADVLDRATAGPDTTFIACTAGARPRPVAFSHNEVRSSPWAALLVEFAATPVEESLPDEQAPEPDGVLAEARRILGDSTLSLDDDLLDVGMTSLGAIRLATMLSVRSGRKVTVGDVYRERRLSAFPDTLAAPVVSTIGDTGYRPLTHAQKRFLFAEAYAPGSADNIVVEAYELTGPLRPDVLRAALGDVVARHEALSTVYVWERGQPVQRVLTDTPVPWTEGPLTADLWDTPFRLDRELPIRARLDVLAPNRAVLYLQFHHIAFDGSSELPLLDDLRYAYLTRLDGGVPHLPAEPGYSLLGAQEERDLASWSADDLPYWRAVLADCPPPCLPTLECEAAAHETVRRLDATTVGKLAMRTAGPLLAALAAGAALALARAFDVDDVCVGTLTAGRFDPATDRLVGYLVNPFAVPLRGLRRESGLVLAAATRQVVDGLEHARTPFDELVRELRGVRPWFEAWVVLQHPPPDVALGPVALRPVRVPPPRTSRAWLVEAFPLADGGWDLVTTWRADALTDAQGAALADDLAEALTELAGG